QPAGHATLRRGGSARDRARRWRGGPAGGGTGSQRAEPGKRLRDRPVRMRAQDGNDLGPRFGRVTLVVEPLRPKPDRIDGRRPPGASAQPGSSVRAALIDPQGSLVRRLGASQIAGRLGRAAFGYLGQRVSLELGDALKTLPSTPAVVLALRRSVGA